MAKNPYWKTIYFDGFAGSGERKKKEDLELMHQLAIMEAEEQVYQGATDSCFDFGSGVSIGTTSSTRRRTRAMH
ncbi:MAG: hypothetical protein IPG74_01530 [Flavobacteriales bacterium]|nr:hypothetical protein [Flavobacteriales bacterium]